ncbi:MAG TPA: hypothetical protein VGM27_08765 [Acidobacteriaceae bacterium]
MPRGLIAACCALWVWSLAATAQMGPSSTASGSETGTITAPSNAFDPLLSLIEKQMMGAVNAMPAEKYGFAPSATMFVPGQTTEFAKVRTFAQQPTHVAQANYFFYGLISGIKPIGMYQESES